METVCAVRTARFSLTLPGARSGPGRLARLGAKIAALHLAVAVNLAVALHLTRGRPGLATLHLLA